MFAWIASIVLGAIAILLAIVSTFAKNVDGPGVAFYLLDLGLMISAALLFPPFWRWQTTMSWRRLRIAAAALLAVGIFFLPIKTHAVKLDMPPPDTQH